MTLLPKQPKHYIKKPPQILSATEQSRDLWRWLVCIQAAFARSLTHSFTFTQVIKSCWRGKQGCSVSLGSFAALYETGSTNTKAHMCSHLKICFHFPHTSSLCFFQTFCLSLTASLFLLLLLIFLCFRYHPAARPTLSLITSFTSTVSFPILPHSFQPPPQLLSFTPSGRATVLSGICWIW